MFLQSRGLSTSRRQAFRLFGVKPIADSFPGLTHSQITHVLRRTSLFSDVRWDTHRDTEYSSFLRRVDDSLRVSCGPIILTYYVTHNSLPLRCQHATLALQVKSSSIFLLDPLGPARADKPWNAITSPSPKRPHRHPVHSTPYSIDLRHSVRILRALPP